MEKKIESSKSPLFGRADLEEVYLLTKKNIFDKNVFKMSQYNEEDGKKVLTICNLWRIEKNHDGSLKTLEFDLKKSKWISVTNISRWPIIPYGSVSRNRSIKWGENIIRVAIWKCLRESGYGEIRRVKNEISDWKYNSNGLPESSAGIKKEMLPYQMANILFSYYIGRNGKKGILSASSMEAGSRSLVYHFFTGILDKKLSSAVLSMDYKNGFHDYLFYGLNYNDFTKVAEENRNLLPLLKRIDKKHWGKDDLFSLSTWCKLGRERAPIDSIIKKEFREISTTKSDASVELKSLRVFSSFDLRYGWDWLSKASTMIVREWNGDQHILSNIVLSQFSGRAPVLAYSRILSSGLMMDFFEISEFAQRIIYLFLSHCENKWKDDGYKETRRWLTFSDNSDISKITESIVRTGRDPEVFNSDFTWASAIRIHEEDRLNSHLYYYEYSMQSRTGSPTCILPYKNIPEFTIDGVTVSQISDINNYHAKRQFLMVSGGYCINSVSSGETEIFTLEGDFEFGHGIVIKNFNAMRFFVETVAPIGCVSPKNTLEIIGRIIN